MKTKDFIRRVEELGFDTDLADFELVEVEE